jgi:hypothetical protein
MLIVIMLFVIMLGVIVLCSVPSHYANCSYSVITLGVVILSGITPYTVGVNLIKVLLRVILCTIVFLWKKYSCQHESIILFLKNMFLTFHSIHLNLS